MSQPLGTAHTEPEGKGAYGQRHRTEWRRAECGLAGHMEGVQHS